MTEYTVVTSANSENLSVTVNKYMESTCFLPSSRMIAILYLQKILDVLRPYLEKKIKSLPYIFFYAMVTNFYFI